MPKVILRNLRIDDAKLMLEWMMDCDIYNKMQYNYEKLNIDTCVCFIKDSWNDEKNLHWAISNINDEYLGTVSLKNIDNKNKNAELGIVVHPAHMRKGLASAALHEIAKKAFFELNLNKIYLYVRADNKRAISFYEKNQMEFEGCAKEHLLINSEYKDILWFCLRKGNYNQWNKLINGGKLKK